MSNEKKDWILYCSKCDAFVPHSRKEKEILRRCDICRERKENEK